VTTYSSGDGRIIIACEVGQCSTTFTTPAPSSEAARAVAAQHNYGWYTRRQRRRVADACSFHLGSCCIAHTRPGEPGVDPAAILPPPRLEPMSEEAAAWVREHAWPRALAAALGPIESCPCQYGPSSWCLHGSCHRCRTSEPAAMPETYITDRAGLVPLSAEFRGGHPAVWLADRVCQWRCSCDCHAVPVAAARPVRYEAVMLPGFDLVDA
jgi:hypothetical protein